MPLNLSNIVRVILQEYALSWDGDHGVPHWARVFENGERLASVTGAHLEVVQLFALFHDSKRVKEYHDSGHGARGAEFAVALRGKVFDLSDEDFTLLHRACAGHTDERNHPDVTVQTCWDADRLDLGRVGVVPHPSRLCTEAACDPAMLNWAHGRASFGVVPSIVQEDWGIDLATESG